jgi:hypothetical protein
VSRGGEGRWWGGYAAEARLYVREANSHLLEQGEQRGVQHAAQPRHVAPGPWQARLHHTQHHVQRLQVAARPAIQRLGAGGRSELCL